MDESQHLPDAVLTGAEPFGIGELPHLGHLLSQSPLIHVPSYSNDTAAGRDSSDSRRDGTSDKSQYLHFGGNGSLVTVRDP